MVVMETGGHIRVWDVGVQAKFGATGFGLPERGCELERIPRLLSAPGKG